MNVTPANASGAASPAATLPAPPAAQSSALGSHGSFWLPTEAKASGRSGSDASGKGARHTPDGRGQAKQGADRPASDVRQVLQRSSSSARGSGTPSGKAAPTGASETSGWARGQLGAAPLPNGNGSAAAGAGSAVSAKPGPAQASLSARENTAGQHAQKGRGADSELSSEKGKRFVHPDGQRDTNKDGRRGTKNARDASEPVSRDKDPKSEVSERFESQVSRQGATPSTGEIAGKVKTPECLRPVLPLLQARIASHLREGRRVARFALDLPGGAKLGVRVEVADGKTRLAFLSPDPALRAALRNGTGPLAEALGGLEADSIQVAADYRELAVQALPKAA